MNPIEKALEAAKKDRFGMLKNSTVEMIEQALINIRSGKWVVVRGQLVTAMIDAATKGQTELLGLLVAKMNRETALQRREEEEEVIVCDGCGKDMQYEGQIHEIIHDPADRFPELCGYGIKVQRREEPARG